MDLDIEIAKCGKKLDLARLNLQKIVKMETQADYEDTVPANVRLANEDKVWLLLSIVFGFLYEMITTAQNSRSRDCNAGIVERNVFQVKVICALDVYLNGYPATRIS